MKGGQSESRTEKNQYRRTKPIEADSNKSDLSTKELSTNPAFSNEQPSRIPARTSSGRAPAQSSENEITQSLPIPEYKMGWIVGKGGSYINQLSRKSGAKLTISESTSKEYGTVWKYVQIKGTGRAVDRAKKLLHIRLERLEPRSDLVGKASEDVGLDEEDYSSSAMEGLKGEGVLLTETVETENDDYDSSRYGYEISEDEKDISATGEEGSLSKTIKKV